MISTGEMAHHHAQVKILQSVGGLNKLQRFIIFEAEAIYRDVLATLLDAPDTDQDQLVIVLEEYALVLRRTGRDTEALTLETRARALRDPL